jgi:hypothetical protein
MLILLEKLNEDTCEVLTGLKVKLRGAESQGKPLSITKEDTEEVGFVGTRWRLSGAIGNTVALHIGTTTKVFEVYDASVHR